MTAEEHQAVREVPIVNKEGLHARPVMRFVDTASRFVCDITVTNVTKKNATVDGKSAMHMMLLEATQGNVLRIETSGIDAEQAAEELAQLVRDAFRLT